MGVAAAKAYSAAWGVPFYAVNHLGGHLAADVYEHGPLPECVALLVSGGHTHLLHVRSLGEPIVELGSTVDDAAGEAYDKVARLLGLGYPGGKVLDDLARTGDRDAVGVPARHDRPGATTRTRSASPGSRPLSRATWRRHPDCRRRRCRGRLPGGRRRCADHEGGARGRPSWVWRPC